MTETSTLPKPGVCDECGFRIRDGSGTHDRCTPDETENEDVPQTPPNPEARPQREFQTECGCPACSNPMMDEMAGPGLCIECFTEDCDPYDEWGVNCD